MQFIGYILATTDRALLFQDHFWHEPGWLPKSQVTVIRDDETMETKLVASPWICKAKNLQEFEERMGADE